MQLKPVESPPAQSPQVVPLVIISPVRDESEFLRLTMNAVVAQTARPIEWILVDDGSADATPDIIREYAEKYPFIRLVERKDRGYRKLGGGVVAAFDYGKDRILHTDYAFIAKLDGDMSFGPHYIEYMLRALADNSRLACVSGKVYRFEHEQFIEEFHQPEQVAGQFKLYRREAFEDIGGFVQLLSWDGIDIHTCHMKGWETRSFYDEDAWLWHHRIMGSSDRNIYVGRLRWGRGNWTMGYHPLFAVAVGVSRMRETPLVIGGLLMIVGYFWSAIRRVPRYDNLQFRRYLRRSQMQRFKAAMRGGKPGRVDESS